MSQIKALKTYRNDYRKLHCKGQDGTLITGFLKKFFVVFDYGNSKMYLKPDNSSLSDVSYYGELTAYKHIFPLDG